MRKIIDWIRTKLTIAEQFYSIIFCSVLFILAYLLFSTRQNNYVSSYQVLGVMADSLLITVLCMLLRGKWKYIAVIFPVFLSFLVWSIIIYFRNFSDFIPGPMFFNSQLSDSLVLRNALSSIRISDFFLLLAFFFPLFYVLKIPVTGFVQSNIRLSMLCKVGIVTLIIWIFPYGYFFIKNSIRFEDIDTEYNLQIIFSDNKVSWKANYDKHHFTGYIINSLAKLNKSSYPLTSADITFIKSHIKIADSRHVPSTTTESLTGNANVIIIIVESLPWKIFELPILKDVAPTLYTLKNDSTVILKEMKCLAMTGRSSDAQFIYNTGLLPLRDSPLVTFYATNKYPSIAKALNISSTEIIGENKGLWSHGATSQSYGYRKLISSVAESPINQDSLIFQRAWEEIENEDTPFLLTVSTLSMHNPYTFSAVTPNPTISNMELEDERDREYFQRLNHFDRSLYHFLQLLKQKHIFEKSIILIMGDHEIASWNVSAYLHDENVPLIILNSPTTDVRNSNITQLDVFPSILDLKGVEYKFLGVEYRGLGKSIFKGSDQDTLPHEITEDDFKVSEMLIKGPLLTPTSK